LEELGIEIKTLRELDGDPDRNRKVYDLFWETFADVPKERAIEPMDFDEWVDWTVNDPMVPHDGYIVAVHDLTYVGLSEFGRCRENDALEAGLVGVRRAYRGLGVALAMQLRAIAFAKAKGHPVIRTSTSVTNQPMLGLYTRLGFVAQPDWIQLEKRLSATLPELGQSSVEYVGQYGWIRAMSIRKEFPILEYDPDRHPLIDIDLEQDAMPGMPEHCVMCWFWDVFDTLAEKGEITRFSEIKSEMGAHPVYLYTTGDRTLALVQQAVGAPLAAGLLEETIALGGRKFIACGGAGVLDRTVAMGQLLVPVSAVRDEGTSYHYLPPAREVAPTPAAVAAIESVLTRRGIEYVLTKTWTTDAYFRETRKKVALRREEGCLTV
jgi:GNAT superfamily N-acetyltransferase